MATETETLTVIDVCESTVGTELQETFKLDKLILLEKKQLIGTDGTFTVFKITVEGREYALKQFNENINTEFANFCIVQPPKTYCLVKYGNIFGIITELTESYVASLTPIPPTQNPLNLPRKPVPTPRTNSRPNHKGGARKSKRNKTKRKALNKTRTIRRKNRTMKKAKKIVNRKKK